MNLNNYFALFLDILLFSRMFLSTKPETLCFLQVMSETTFYSVSRVEIFVLHKVVKLMLTKYLLLFNIYSSIFIITYPPYLPALRKYQRTWHSIPPPNFFCHYHLLTTLFINKCFEFSNLFEVFPSLFLNQLLPPLLILGGAVNNQTISSSFLKFNVHSL